MSSLIDHKVVTELTRETLNRPGPLADNIVFCEQASRTHRQQIESLTPSLFVVMMEVVPLDDHGRAIVQPQLDTRTDKHVAVGCREAADLPLGHPLDPHIARGHIIPRK